MVSYILPINVYIAILSTLEIVKGYRQAREIIGIINDSDFFDRINR